MLFRSLQFNELTNIGECAFSISDSISVSIFENKIFNSNLAAIETYNSSIVDFYDNYCDVNGLHGFLSYSGARISIKNNIFKNISSSFGKLTYKGGCNAINNQLFNCKKLFEGDTIGSFFFNKNGNFKGLTNDLILFESHDVELIPKFSDDLNGKCICCQKNPRNCFLQTCGHNVYCLDCGKKALENNESCPLCRFPIEKITTGFNGAIDTDCAICFERKADSIVFPCGHIGFCFECLSKWFNDNETCPFCSCSGSSFRKIPTDV